MRILITILTISLVLFSCKDIPTKTKDANTDNDVFGKISFQIDLSTAPSEVVDLKGVLTRDDYSEIPFNFFYDDTTKSASVEIENIPIGNWNLQVDALDEFSTIVYNGTATVSVEPAVITNVNLYLTPTSGSIIINVQWGDLRELSDLDEFLVGYWNFDDSGIYDLSPNNNHGSVFGNARFLPGKKGNAINFDGYNGYAQIPNDSIYFIDEKTISFWIYKNNDYILETEGKNDGEGIIGKSYDSGFNRDFTFAISGNNARFHVYGTIGTESEIDTLIVTGKTQAISPSYWYHCVLVVGYDHTAFYLNGTRTESNNKENPSINSTAPIVLGKAFVSSLPTRYFNGMIDEFRIYNKAFSEEEVQLLYIDAL